MTEFIKSSISNDVYIRNITKENDFDRILEKLARISDCAATTNTAAAASTRACLTRNNSKTKKAKSADCLMQNL